MVPGRATVGLVVDMDNDVKRLKIGDHVAVGCMGDSCQHCNQCRKREEQRCREGSTRNYNSKVRITGEPTYGGDARYIVVREDSTLRVPDSVDMSRSAPLLCTGISTHSPLRTWNVSPGSRVRVIGLGGLGHMAVKLAVALGADVVVVNRTTDKTADALPLGVDRLLVSTDVVPMTQAANRIDLIIDTVPVKSDIKPYLTLMDIDGKQIPLGSIGPLAEPSTIPMLMGRCRLAGSLIGGSAEMQEMLDFCAKKNVLSDCEMVRMDEINDAFERVARAYVQYRFVLDTTSLAALCA